MKILIAGSTGYLGQYLVKELLARKIDFRAIARAPRKLTHLGLAESQIISAQLTDKESVKGCCHGIDVVISTVGITRQKDGLTYMDVDYQANQNLLEEAIKSGVKKFIYISVLHGEQLTHLKICKAKERFVRSLQQSGLAYCVIRPSGFFSDLSAFLEMAENGRVYLFGDGLTKANPIHGADLAKICVDAVYWDELVIEVGGREILSQREIAELAFEVADKKPKITYIPDWTRRLMLRLAALFLGKSQHGPVEFFLNVMAMDMTTNPYGQRTLRSFFQQLKAAGSAAS